VSQTKLSHALPHLVVVCASMLHDADVVAATLRAELPATTPFLGVPSIGGVVVDGQWLHARRRIYMAVTSERLSSRPCLMRHAISQASGSRATATSSP
jgi:hypothetical protein